MKLFQTFFKAFFIFTFFSVFSVFQLKAQCTVNSSTCTPGVAGPFNFVNPGPPVSTCLDWIGTSTAYIILHVTSSGPLNMLIDGNLNTGYLDVAVFNIPNGQSPCTAIQNNANQLGCNYATAAVGCNQFGNAFACGSSAPAPNVTAGQELMIVVENWTGSASDFTLSLGPAPGAQTGPPNPAITPAGPFCSTGPATQLIAADMGGTWSGPGVSSSGMFNPSTAGPGTHTINYSVGVAPCNANSSTTIVVNPPPTLTITPATVSICAGQSATLTASGATGYSWNPGGGSSASITVTPATTTTYTVTSPGCSGSATRTITVTPLPNVTVNSPTICVGQTATLTANNATSYTWSAGVTSTGINTGTVSPTVTTTYTVTGTSSGCSKTAVSTVTVTPSPTITVTSPVICNGQTATLTGSGGTTYTWSAGATSSGANTATASPNTTTTYTVTGTNGSCSNTAISTVTVNPIPTINSTSATICPGGNATITASGGTSYSWSTGSTASSISVSPGATTTYTVTGTSSGCTNTAVGTVTVGTSMTITVNSPTICAGQTANLIASGATSYTWSAGATPTGTGNADASPVATTSYTVTGTTGTCSGTAVATVTITTVPNVTVNSPVICNGATANLAAAGATTYTWSAGATATGTATADASPTITTTYTVTGANGTCTNTAVSTVTVNAIPTIIVNSPTICAGSTAQLTANGATSYTWSAGASSTGSNTATASPASTASYTVTGTSLGCTGTAVSTVTVNTSMTVDAGLNDSICFGGSSNLSVSPNGPGYTYTWTPAGSLTNAAIFNPVATPGSTTTYSVNISDLNGCAGSATVTVFANTQILVNVAGIPANCNGESDGQTIVIPSGGSSPYTYSWTGGCTSAACNQPAGSYTVTVTDSWSSGCTATGTATVTEPTAVTATSTQVNVNCAGACNGTATANPTGGTPGVGGTYNYSWNTVPVQTTQTATGLCPGTYTCVITDNNGCSPSSPVVVTITEPTQLVINPISPITICNSSSTVLTSSVVGGSGTYTYVWSPAAGLSSTTSSNPTAAPASPGATYILTVTDANLCTAQISVIVNVNPPLSVVTTGTTTICPGFSAPLSATASNGSGSGYIYSWLPTTGLNNSAIGNPTATPASTTTYTVTVNDGCSPSITSTVTVTVLPPPVPTITASAVSGCAPLCVTFTETSSGSAVINGWGWNFGDPSANPGTGQVASNCYTTAGTYIITVTDTSSGGCIVTSAPFIITVNPIPMAEFSAPASTSIFSPIVQYTDQSYVAPGSIVAWDWAFGDPLSSVINDSSILQNPSHAFSEVGTYCAELIVASNAGCRDTVMHCIVIDPEFTFFIPNAFSPNDDGINDEFFGKGENIMKYEMSVYDRWGSLTFYTNDINKHWNGRFNNDGAEVLLEDIYVYTIKITDHHNKVHKYLGTVTIVK